MNHTPQDFDIDALVLAAQEGDKEAFGQLYDHFFDKIFRYVYFRVHSVEVEDLVETVFIKCWTHLDQYEKRDVSFSAWLFRIAHNAVIDHRRSHRAILPIHPSLEDKSDKHAPKERTQKVLMADRLRKEVQNLKEPYRQVITLKFLSGLSNSEIAEILGQREGNVRVLQYRALKELKQRLGDLGFEPEFL